MTDRRSTPPERLPPLLIGAVLFLSTFAAKLPVLDLPCHWDELGAYVPSARWLAEVGLSHALPGRYPPTRFWGHPTLLYVCMAALYELFGYSIRLTHGFAIGLAAWSLYLTYRVGRLIFGVETGILATLLLLLSPLFFAQAGLFHGDMFVTAMGLLVIYFHLSKKVWAYLLSCSLLLLLKETGLAFVAAIVLHQLVVRRNREGGLHPLVLATPAVVPVLFFGAQYATTGQLFANPYFAHHALLRDSPGAGWPNVAAWLFAQQGRWIPTLAILAAALLRRERFWRSELGLLAVLVFLFWAVFSSIYALPRYLLPVFPYLCIAAGWALSLLGKRWRAVPFVALGALVVVFVAGLGGRGTGSGSYETDMQYVDIVKAHRDAARYIESRHPDAQILAAWPIANALAYPYLGYVKQPLDTTGSELQFDLLVWTRQGSPRNRDLLELARSQELERVRGFERNGKEVVVYRRCGRAGCASAATGLP